MFNVCCTSVDLSCILVESVVDLLQRLTEHQPVGLPLELCRSPAPVVLPLSPQPHQNASGGETGYGGVRICYASFLPTLPLFTSLVGAVWPICSRHLLSQLKVTLWGRGDSRCGTDYLTASHMTAPTSDEPNPRSYHLPQDSLLYAVREGGGRVEGVIKTIGTISLLVYNMI